MSTRLYLKPGIGKSQESEARDYGSGERAYLWPDNINFDRLGELDPSKMKNVEYLTVEDSFWKDKGGYSFLPGRYEGEGFDVEIGPSHVSYRGSEKNGYRDWSQKIFGRFDSVDIAITFWDLLTRGQILPTRPLCRELSMTEQAYAKQASAGVAAMAKLGNLQVLVAQQANQLQALAQLVQDHILTPKKA